jgi:ElaB/YqjD/DUF883 family membrane-anchored ribosome-binding protein
MTMAHDNALSGAMESTRDAIADTKSTISDASARVQDKASELGRKASSKFDAGRIAAADKLESAAETLHDRVNRFGEIGHDTADRVDATARYIRKNGAKEMVSDVGELVKAHPGKALLVAAAVGFLAARALRGSTTND